MGAPILRLAQVKKLHERDRQMALRIKQRTLVFDCGEKETIIEVNGCTVVHAVFNRESKDWGTSRHGFVVKSFIGDHNGEIVKSGFDNWSAVRKAARQYAKDNFHRHAEKHGLSLT